MGQDYDEQQELKLKGKEKEIELYLKSRGNSDWKAGKAWKRVRFWWEWKEKLNNRMEEIRTPKSEGLLQLNDRENFKMTPLRETVTKDGIIERGIFEERVQKSKVFEKSLWGLPPLIIQYYTILLQYFEISRTSNHFFSTFSPPTNQISLLKFGYFVFLLLKKKYQFGS